MGKAVKKNKPAAGKKKRDLNAELLQALDEAKRGKWARKTEFFPQPDGSMRRVITRRDGTVEKDHIIPAEKSLVALHALQRDCPRPRSPNFSAYRSARFRSGNRDEKFPRERQPRCSKWPRGIPRCCKSWRRRPSVHDSSS